KSGNQSQSTEPVLLYPCDAHPYPVRFTVGADAEPGRYFDSSPVSHIFHMLSTSCPYKTRAFSGKRVANRCYVVSVSVSLLSNLFKSLSFLRTVSILSTECITVVWCLPPNWRPISGSEASVRCFARYIAICRGKTMLRELFFCLISATRSPNCSATAFWIESMVILRVCCSMKFLSTCCAVCTVTSAPVNEQ